MIFAILTPFVFVILVGLGVQKIRSGEFHDEVNGQSVKRFFQYLILYGLLLVVAVGLTGLLNEALNQSRILITDQTSLARSYSFVVVGIPLFIGVAIWVRKSYLRNKVEAETFGWGLYFTLASITTLSMAMLAFNDLLSWGIGNSDYQGHSTAQFLIWGVFWLAHWILNSRFTHKRNSRLHFLLGSLIGLVSVLTGLSRIFTGTLERILHLGGNSFLITQSDPIKQGVIALIIGTPVWIIYWIKSASKLERDSLWFGYVLVAGVTAGMATAIASVSTVIYTTLVWIIGDASSRESAIHFRDVPTAAGIALACAFSWWYHRAILHEEKVNKRSEAQRIYEYLMSGMGLLASAFGIAIVLIAALEGITSSTVIVTSGSDNTLLAAATLLLVGSPIWWIYWRKIQAFVINSPEVEHASPTRRIYLFILFGVGGLSAIVTLIVGTFFVFDDAFKGAFGMDTLRRMRIPLGLLLSTGVIAGYHWSIYRKERINIEQQKKTKSIVVFGPPEWSVKEIVDALQGFTSSKASISNLEEKLTITPIENAPPFHTI